MGTKYDSLMEFPLTSPIGHLAHGLSDGEDFDDSHIRQSEAEKNLHQSKASDADALRGNIAQQQKDASRNKGGIYAGRDTADFWHGSSENLKGVTNATNRANLGAKLGTAHSVMDNKGRLAGAQEKLGKTQQLGESFADAKNQEGRAKSGDASMALEGQMHESDMQNRELDRAQKAREQSRKLVAGIIHAGAAIATGGASLSASAALESVKSWGDGGSAARAPDQVKPSNSVITDTSRNINQNSGASPLQPNSPLMERTAQSISQREEDGDHRQYSFWR